MAGMEESLNKYVGEKDLKSILDKMITNLLQDQPEDIPQVRSLSPLFCPSLPPLLFLLSPPRLSCPSCLSSLSLYLSLRPSHPSPESLEQYMVNYLTKTYNVGGGAGGSGDNSRASIVGGPLEEKLEIEDDEEDEEDEECEFCRWREEGGEVGGWGH